MKALLKSASLAALGTLLCGGFALAAVGNDHTGFNSENNATIEQESEARIETENDAHIMNEIDGMLRTGFNRSSYNTGNGKVYTGDADATVEVANKANESTVSIGGASWGAAVPDVENSTTGAESENNAWIEVENELRVEVENDAHVDNDIAVMTSTGGNSSSYNTGSGEVSTGDASLHVDLSSTLNSSEVTVH